MSLRDNSMWTDFPHFSSSTKMQNLLQWLTELGSEHAPRAGAGKLRPVSKISQPLIFINNVWLEYSLAHSFMYRLWHTPCWNSRVEQRQQRSYRPQSQTYLLCGPTGKAGSRQNPGRDGGQLGGEKPIQQLAHTNKAGFVELARQLLNKDFY